MDYAKYFWSDGRIVLRPQTDEDAALLWNCTFDSDQHYWFDASLPPPMTLDAFAGYCRPGENDMGLIIEDAEGQAVGIINVYAINERDGQFSAGVMVIPSARGKGYGLAAMRLVGAYMFGERRMHKWNSDYVEGNEGSEKMHKRLGFQYEGTRRDLYYHNGRWWNSVLCGLTAEDFFAAREAK